MKWRNGKYERVIEMSDYDGTWYDVEIYARNPHGCLELVDVMHFIYRSEAVVFAGKQRHARMYPGCLLGGEYKYE